MKAKWIITKSYIETLPHEGSNNVQPLMVAARNGGPSYGRIEFPKDCDPAVDVEVSGPRDAEAPDLDALTHDCALVDDDMNVYYTGRWCEEAEFEPLDMYGTPDAGAVHLFIKRGEYWEAL